MPTNSSNGSRCSRRDDPGTRAADRRGPRADGGDVRTGDRGAPDRANREEAKRFRSANGEAFVRIRAADTQELERIRRAIDQGIERLYGVLEGQLDRVWSANDVELERIRSAGADRLAEVHDLLTDQLERLRMERPPAPPPPDPIRRPGLGDAEPAAVLQLTELVGKGAGVADHQQEVVGVDRGAVVRVPLEMVVRPPALPVAPT